MPSALKKSPGTCPNSMEAGGYPVEEFEEPVRKEMVFS